MSITKTGVSRKMRVKFRNLFTNIVHEVRGREAWALLELHRAGPLGCTPLHNPAPRWSAYVFKLRKKGLVIETIHEPHGGPFLGHHGRYVLHTEIEILEQDLPDIPRAAFDHGHRPLSPEAR